MKYFKILCSVMFLTGIVCSVSSCYYDSEEYIYGTGGSADCGDTAVYTYAAGVQPILSKYCYTCHSNSSYNSMGGGIKLQDYADVKTKVNDNTLYGTVSHGSGYSPMPKGGDQLLDCNISILKKWIDHGALNN